MANSTVYALDAGGNKIETLTKEQILAAIQAAVETGQIPETLAAAIESIIEQNTSANIKFWVGTQAQFLELANTEENTLYFITDLTTVKDISNALDTLTQGLKDGSITVKKASEADKATEVTEKINGKNITDIFESNGTTAKKATEAGNVTGKINGKNITDIFESNGTTAKKATTIGKYQHNIRFQASNDSFYEIVCYCSFNDASEAAYTKSSINFPTDLHVIATGKAVISTTNSTKNAITAIRKRSDSALEIFYNDTSYADKDYFLLNISEIVSLSDTVIPL